MNSLQFGNFQIVMEIVYHNTLDLRSTITKTIGTFCVDTRLPILKNILRNLLASYLNDPGGRVSHPECLGIAGQPLDPKLCLDIHRSRRSQNTDWNDTFLYLQQPRRLYDHVERDRYVGAIEHGHAYNTRARDWNTI